MQVKSLNLKKKLRIYSIKCDQTMYTLDNSGSSVRCYLECAINVWYTRKAAKMAFFVPNQEIQNVAEIHTILRHLTVFGVFSLQKSVHYWLLFFRCSLQIGFSLVEWKLFDTKCLWNLRVFWHYGVFPCLTASW